MASEKGRNLSEKEIAEFNDEVAYACIMVHTAHDMIDDKGKMTEIEPKEFKGTKRDVKEFKKRSWTNDGKITHPKEGCGDRRFMTVNLPTQANNGETTEKELEHLRSYRSYNGLSGSVFKEVILLL